MDTSEIEDILEHAGVKGMKWGVRKNPKASSGTTKKVSGKNSSSTDRKAVDKIREKKVSQMSDKQLKRAINRMNLEKQYRDLSPSKMKKGHNKVKSAIAVAGTVNALILLGKSPAGKAAARGASFLFNAGMNAAANYFAGGSSTPFYPANVVPPLQIRR